MGDMVAIRGSYSESGALQELFYIKNRKSKLCLHTKCLPFTKNADPKCIQLINKTMFLF